MFKSLRKNHCLVIQNGIQKIRQAIGKTKMVTKETVKEIQKKCMCGRITVPQAVSEIDRTIGGITGVLFKDGKQFKILNHTAMFPLQFSGYQKKQMDIVYGLATMAYLRAQENGSIHPGEVHISREASTKHHMDGIFDLISKYLPLEEAKID